MSRIENKYISNNIVLIDYGLSFHLDNPPYWVGTITNYLAPECYFENHISKASDVWALGCVIYELFTGQRLFKHDNVDKVMAQMVPILGLFPSKWYSWSEESECLGQDKFHDVWLCNDQDTKPPDTRIPLKQKSTNHNISLLGLSPSRHLLLSKRGAAALAGLLESMLCYSPQGRISADQVLQHRFFRADCARMVKCGRV